MHPITYSDSGVSIQKSEESLSGIKGLIEKTNRPEVLSGIGSFGGLFELQKYNNPVLVSSTDGVGTKLKIAFLMNKHDTIGYDLVSHCGNDIAVQGAEPLFFLDYFGTSNLDKEVFTEVIKGITKGCQDIGASLIGGETAEMPGFYNKGEYDLVGSIVGVVEKGEVITGENIIPGDIVLGFPSLGLHTNGFSLARKVLFDVCGYSVEDYVEQLGCTVGVELLKPHCNYVKVIHSIKSYNVIKGIAHITGGGLPGNIIRILPEGCRAILDKDSWPSLPVFKFIQQQGNIKNEEMFSTFNMSIGLVIVVNPKDSDTIVNRFNCFKIGYIQENIKGVSV